MTETPRTLRVGAVTVTIINVGDIQGALSAWMDEPPGGWPESLASRLTQSERFPTQCVHIAAPDYSVLVDAGVFEDAPQSPFPIPHYQPPPGLLDQLQSVGVQPSEVQHVVITHTHQDHFNGTTRGQQPAFPNARYAVGRADWERADIQLALQNAHSVESQTLGVIQQAGVLDLVEGNWSLGEHIRIIAAPGETAGHQIVRVQSEGQTLYYVADLYHHIIEVEQPECIMRWADTKSMQASRRALAEAALAENAWLVATHIPAIGRLQRTATGVAWGS